ncbi:hypothetical protein C8F04DRAFT_1182990 [Mycena alexandri]|uniref:Uncharacterized protein n=1 Tax=Mycena alexandri TaxID=1745969 RepID=A0AAD6X3Z9_9AGAR|nr:hypothetical protein C8F04DRAFT_1182990 [Mycena alexandri]
MEHYVLKRDVPAGGQKNLTKLERKSKEVQSENIHIVNIAGTPARCLRRPQHLKLRKEIDKKVEFEAIHVEVGMPIHGQMERGEGGNECRVYGRKSGDPESGGIKVLSNVLSERFATPRQSEHWENGRLVTCFMA